MEFRKRQGGSPASIHIDGAEVERVSCFKFLCVFIKDDLIWSRHADSAIKTAQKRLYFLRRLKLVRNSHQLLQVHSLVQTKESELRTFLV